MIDAEYKRILLEHPFISYLTYGGNDYIGIIQNSDEFITTMYDYSVLLTKEQRQSFVTLAEQWWWESNRLIPINVFLNQEWLEFKFSAKTFNSKDVIIKHGPYVSLRETAQKRSKRRSITLVRRVN